MIPEAAVEAAARALWQTNQHDDEWVDEFPEYMDYLRAEAIRVLEAAAPHMLADAWDEGSIAGWVESGLPHSWNAENSLRNSNPYRSQP